MATTPTPPSPEAITQSLRALAARLGEAAEKARQHGTDVVLRPTDARAIQTALASAAQVLDTTPTQKGTTP